MADYLSLDRSGHLRNKATGNILVNFWEGFPIINEPVLEAPNRFGTDPNTHTWYETASMCFPCDLEILMVL